MKTKKKIPPFDVELETYRKLLKIIANRSDQTDKFVSVRDAIVTLIHKEYSQISGSMKW